MNDLCCCPTEIQRRDKVTAVQGVSGPVTPLVLTFDPTTLPSTQAVTQLIIHNPEMKNSLFLWKEVESISVVHS